MTVIWNRTYPGCVVFHVLDDGAYAFHMTSVLITTLLSVQKAFAMLFPMWAQTFLTVNTSIIASTVALCCSLSLFMPTTISTSQEMSNASNGMCCYSDQLVSKYLNNESYNSWLNESIIWKCRISKQIIDVKP